MSSLILPVFITIALLATVFLVIEVVARPSLKHLVFGAAAVIIGLIIGALLAVPLSNLPGDFGEYLPLGVSIVFAFAGLLTYRKISPLIDQWLTEIAKVLGVTQVLTRLLPKEHRSFASAVVIDSSALIDFRVVEIIRTGFLSQKVVIPRFILAEVQNIADSKDNDRREKGKRGLKAIEKIRHLKGSDFEISSLTDEALEVDHRLVAICKKAGLQLLTTDYNLNKVASAEGVRVLNVNELAQGLRPELLPGDKVKIKLVHTGKDKTQGVGYLSDGTMIVVENTGKMVGKEVEARVERGLQTAAGKMYFGKVTK